MAYESGSEEPATIVDILAAQAAARNAVAGYVDLLASLDDLDSERVKTLGQHFTVKPIEASGAPLFAQKVLWDAYDVKSTVLGQRPVTRRMPFEAISFMENSPQPYAIHEGHFEFQSEPEGPEPEDIDAHMKYWRLIVPTKQFLALEVTESRYGKLLPFKWLGGQVVPVSAEDRVAVP